MKHKGPWSGLECGENRWYVCYIRGAQTALFSQLGVP